jgi:hypothetical protein
VLLGLNEVSIDRLFAQSLARFEAMQPVCEDETITIAPNLDGCFLSDFQHTLRDLLDDLWFERCAALYWYVDVRDRNFSRLIMACLRRKHSGTAARFQRH